MSPPTCVALGVGAVEAVGYCGDDGEGYELRRAMRQLGLRLDRLSHGSGPLDPNPIKSPCYVASNQRGRPVLEELERLDVKNRRPTPTSLQRDLIDLVRQRLSHWDGLVLIDQVAEANCGVLTTRVRARHRHCARPPAQARGPRRFAHAHRAI